MEALFRSVIEALYPLNRSICSPGLDKALELIRERFIPELTIEGYPTSSSAWTWTLPKKWDLKDAWLEHNGTRVIDYKSEPLCVWSGSLPVDGELGYEDFMSHVYSDSSAPELLRWYFKYYGELDWGFNLPGLLVKTFRPGDRFRFKIDSTYYNDLFNVGNIFIPGKSRKTILIISDVCHPYQCNDSLSGAAVSMGLYEVLKKRKNFFSYRFVFVPETIGTIAYLSNNEKLIPDMIYALYSEFWGRDGVIHLQHSLAGDTDMDRAIESVLNDKVGEGNYRKLPFRRGGVKNDEMVTACPGVALPSIALNRISQPVGFFREYHSNQDTPELIRYDKMIEGFEILKESLIRLDDRQVEPDLKEKQFRCFSSKLSKSPMTDFVPVPRFKGSIFLTGFGLWVDWRTQPKLNAALDEITACLNGLNSVSEIAAFVDLPYETVYEYLIKFEKAGLICRGSKKRS